MLLQRVVSREGLLGGNKKNAKARPDALRPESAELIKPGAVFIRVMLGLRGYVSSAKGVSRPLSKRSAGKLVYLAAAKARAKVLSRKAGRLPPELRKDLEDVVMAFDARDVGE